MPGLGAGGVVVAAGQQVRQEPLGRVVVMAQRQEYRPHGGGHRRGGKMQATGDVGAPADRLPCVVEVVPHELGARGVQVDVDGDGQRACSQRGYPGTLHDAEPKAVEPFHGGELVQGPYLPDREIVRQCQLPFALEEGLLDLNPATMTMISSQSGFIGSRRRATRRMLFTAKKVFRDAALRFEPA